MESRKNSTNVGKQKNKELGGIYASALTCQAFPHSHWHYCKYQRY